jgi:hypothetical protein
VDAKSINNSPRPTDSPRFPNGWQLCSQCFSYPTATSFYVLGELLGDAKLSDVGQHRPNPDNDDGHRLGIEGGSSATRKWQLRIESQSCCQSCELQCSRGEFPLVTLCDSRHGWRVASSGIFSRRHNPGSIVFRRRQGTQRLGGPACPRRPIHFFN